MSAAPPDVIRRIVYLGTPGLAVPPLRALVDAGYEIPLVVSRADARRGRGAHRLPSPVKAAALELGLPVTDRLVDLDEVELDEERKRNDGPTGLRAHGPPSREQKQPY